MKRKSKFVLILVCYLLFQTLILKADHYWFYGSFWDNPHVTFTVNDYVDNFRIDVWGALMLTAAIDGDASGAWWMYFAWTTQLPSRYVLIETDRTTGQDSTELFSVRLYGEWWKGGEGSGGPLTYSITANFADELAITPGELTIPINITASFRISDAGNVSSHNWRIAPSGTWTSTYPFYPPTDEAGIFKIEYAPHADGADAREGDDAATLTVVEVESISTSAYSTIITSTTDSPSYDQSICTEAKTSGSLTFTATPNPSGIWPVHGSPEVSYPEWYVGGSKVQDGGSYTFDPNGKAAGVYTIKAKCGSSVKAINVYVVSMVYTLYVREPDPGSGKPWTWAGFTPPLPDPGHAYARVRLTPSDSKNVKPFSLHTACAIVDFMPVGFGTTTRVNAVMTGTGTGTIYLRDSSAWTAYKVHKIDTVSQALSALLEADAWRRPAIPPYVIGTESYNYNTAEGLYIWHWTQPTSQNCLTYTRAIASRSGCTLPPGITASVDLYYPYLAACRTETSQNNIKVVTPNAA